MKDIYPEKKENSSGSAISSNSNPLSNSINNIPPELFLPISIFEAISSYENSIQFCKLGQYVRALAAIEKALKIVPDDASYFAIKGLILHKLGHNEKALADFEAALKKHPAPNEPILVSNKGNVLYSLQRYNEALTCHELALKNSSDNFVYLANKARTLYALERYEETLIVNMKAIDKLLRFKSDLGNLWLSSDIRHADLTLNRSNNDKEIEQYKLQCTQEIFALQIETLTRLRPCSDSKLDSKNLVNKDKISKPATSAINPNIADNGQTFSPSAPLKKRKLNTSEVKRDFSASFSGFSSVFETISFYENSIEFCKRGKYPEALKSIEAALKNVPDDFGYLAIKGLALHKLGRNEEALVYFENALSRSLPNEPILVSNKGNVLYSLKRYTEALACHELVLKNYPNNFIYLSDKAKTLFALGRHEEALDAYNKAISKILDFLRNRHNPFANIALSSNIQNDIRYADLTLNRTKDDKEIDQYKSQRLEEILVNYFETLCQLERYEPARKLIEIALRQNPGNSVYLACREKLPKDLEFKKTEGRPALQHESQAPVSTPNVTNNRQAFLPGLSLKKDDDNGKKENISSSCGLGV